MSPRPAYRYRMSRRMNRRMNRHLTNRRMNHLRSRRPEAVAYRRRMSRRLMNRQMVMAFRHRVGACRPPVVACRHSSHPTFPSCRR